MTILEGIGLLALLIAFYYFIIMPDEVDIVIKMDGEIVFEYHREPPEDKEEK